MLDSAPHILNAAHLAVETLMNSRIHEPEEIEGISYHQLIDMCSEVHSSFDTYSSRQITEVKPSTWNTQMHAVLGFIYTATRHHTGSG